MWSKLRTCLWSIGIPVILASVTVAQDVPVAPAPPTLWNFLGIPQGVKKVNGALFNTRGNHPGLEQKPALKALGDPENLKSPNDAIKKAAQVKQAEDLKPQKIKAIKYLAAVGCGCYDKDGEITKALIAAAEDCTEEVRLATMQELLKASNNKCCSKCGTTCCCKEDLLKKLAQIAYEKDEHGCFIEPSKRVRDAAICVLKSCCPSPIPPTIEQPKVKNGDGVVPETPEAEEGGVEGETPTPDANAIWQSEEETATENVSINFRDDSEPRTVGKPVLPNRVSRAVTVASSEDVVPFSPNPRGGIVTKFDSRRRVALVQFQDQNRQVDVGSTVYIQVDPARGAGFRGVWKVVASSRGKASLVPEDVSDDVEIVLGDHVMLGAPPVSVVPVGYAVAE